MCPPEQSCVILYTLKTFANNNNPDNLQFEKVANKLNEGIALSNLFNYFFL